MRRKGGYIMNNERRASAVFHIGATLLALIAMVPFIWMISTSLKTSGAVITIPIEWIPKKPTFGSYISVFSKDGILGAMINSLLVSVGAVLVVLTSGSMAAFAFAKIPFRGSKALFMLFLAALMIPSQVLFIPIYLIMSELGLSNSLFSLILPNIFKVFAVFMIRQQMMTIPSAYMEAAAIDGASLFAQYRRIILPMCRTTLITLAVIQFMDSWNDFLFPLVLITTKQKYTLPLILNSMSGQYKTEYNLLMAGALISMTPILMVYGALQKYFASGLQMGGVKG